VFSNAQQEHLTVHCSTEQFQKPARASDKKHNTLSYGSRSLRTGSKVQPPLTCRMAKCIWPNTPRLSPHSPSTPNTWDIDVARITIQTSLHLICERPSDVGTNAHRQHDAAAVLSPFHPRSILLLRAAPVQPPTQHTLAGLQRSCCCMLRDAEAQAAPKPDPTTTLLPHTAHM
jgi:hypothetical protein